MAKQITEYEASDIDAHGNPLHKSLFGGVLGALLLGTVKPKEDEDPMKPMNMAIAFLLTSLERDGYVITRREESIPKTFLDGFTGPTE